MSTKRQAADPLSPLWRNRKIVILYCMRRCLLAFLLVLPLLVTGCKKGERNLTQSTPSPTASVSPTPPPDTNRTAKFIGLLSHRFKDTPAQFTTTPIHFR